MLIPREKMPALKVDPLSNGHFDLASGSADPVIGLNHGEALALFEEDHDTDAVVLIGEIGGRSELAAADYILTMTKPVIAYIVGKHTPPGRRMGHAGALMGAD